VFRNERVSDETAAFDAVKISLQALLFPRPDQLRAVLVHRDEVDRTLEGDAFIRHLVELSRARNLRKSGAQLQRLIEQHVRVQKAFKDDAYRVLPLLSPESIECHFLRNRAGRFLGPLEPYFLLEAEEITLDGVNYWSEWQAAFPRFHCVDVEADNHLVMLSDPAAVQRIGEYCKALYGKPAPAEAPSARLPQVRERRRERTKLLQLD
jgi:hypothetical protein